PGIRDVDGDEDDRAVDRLEQSAVDDRLAGVLRVADREARSAVLDLDGAAVRKRIVVGGADLEIAPGNLEHDAVAPMVAGVQSQAVESNVLCALDVDNNAVRGRSLDHDVLRGKRLYAGIPIIARLPQLGMAIAGPLDLVGRVLVQRERHADRLGVDLAAEPA